MNEIVSDERLYYDRSTSESPKTGQSLRPFGWPLFPREGLTLSQGDWPSVRHFARLSPSPHTTPWKGAGKGGVVAFTRSSRTQVASQPGQRQRRGEKGKCASSPAATEGRMEGREEEKQKEEGEE